MTTQQVNMDHILRELNELEYIRSGSYTQGNKPWGSTQQVNMDHMVTALSLSTSGQALTHMVISLEVPQQRNIFDQLSNSQLLNNVSMACSK
jgi:hypothetical protein